VPDLKVSAKIVSTINLMLKIKQTKRKVKYTCKKKTKKKRKKKRVS
jgi:hypothetical protein